MSQYNILVVDDDREIVRSLGKLLELEGYRVKKAYNGMEALDILMTEQIHLILLDVMIPEIDGFELMEYLKPFGVPVIFLTAAAALDNRVKGLRMGAEDYIVKPFEIDELLARVDVVLRRYGKADGVIEVCGLMIDTRAMRVMRGQEELALTRKEYDLFVLFAQNPNVALYRDVIYERVWGGDLGAGSKTVDLHVQRLRKKTGLDACLQAVSKVGYRLVLP